jgi:hypothetical protein
MPRSRKRRVTFLYVANGVRKAERMTRPITSPSFAFAASIFTLLVKLVSSGRCEMRLSYRTERFSAGGLRETRGERRSRANLRGRDRRGSTLGTHPEIPAVRSVLSISSLSKYTHIRVRPVLRVRADADPRRRAGQARKARERVDYERVRRADDRRSSGLWPEEVEQR